MAVITYNATYKSPVLGIRGFLSPKPCWACTGCFMATIYKPPMVESEISPLRWISAFTYN